MPKCPHCGYMNPSGVTMCDECGMELTAESTITPEPKDTTPPKTPKTPETPTTPKTPKTPEEEVIVSPTLPDLTSEEQEIEAPETPVSPLTPTEPTPNVPAIEKTPATPKVPIATGRKTYAKLIVERNGRVGQEFLIDEPIIDIGRTDPEVGAYPHIDLTEDDYDSMISRNHSRIIVKEDGTIWIEDLGSTNGTSINRKAQIPPGEEHQLQDGDLIIIGRIWLRFKMV